MATKVLIVEDEPVVQELLRDWLTGAFPDCTFLVAGSGEEGVLQAAAELPQIVIMDIVLPGISGLEATRQIRDRSPATRVLVLTGYDNREYHAEALAAGVSGYVLKRRMHKELIPILGELVALCSLVVAIVATTAG